MRAVLLWLIYRVIMRFLLKIFAGIHIEGAENLREKGPVIIVANHNSHLDTVTLLSLLPVKKLIRTHPVAAGDYFGKTAWKARLSMFFINALLIPRSRPKEGEEGPDPIAMMQATLDKGHSLIFFPEGSRGEPEKMQNFKRGIGLLLCEKNDIPFIPVYMKGLGKVLPKGDPIPVPHDSFVYIGKAVHTSSCEPDEIVRQVQDEILRLQEAAVTS